MIIIVIEYLYVVVLRNNIGCGKETEVFRSMVVLWCFFSGINIFLKSDF